jgi:hypothetical protein
MPPRPARNRQTVSERTTAIFSTQTQLIPSLAQLPPILGTGEVEESEGQKTGIRAVAGLDSGTRWVNLISREYANCIVRHSQASTIQC